MINEYVERDIERDIIKWVDEREIIALRGPRQSGKSTLLKRIKKFLLEKGVDEKQIHYIDFEDDLVRIQFESEWKEFIKSYLTSGKQYFLLDEVQKINDAGKMFKLIFDSFDNIKIIITGSSTFDLTNLGKSLVGRVIFFDLFPFNLSEFLRAKDERLYKINKESKINLLGKPNIRKNIFLGEMNKLLFEYLTFGGYPRVVLMNDRQKKIELLKNLFINYVEKDIVSLYGNKYRDNAVKLLQSLSFILGNVLNYETLSEHSGLNYKEVKEIVPLLESSFVISVVKPFYKNLMNELRKNPKIYFVDFGIRNYLLGNFDNLDFEKLYENFVHNQLKTEFKVNYWRTTAKTEVDFIAQKGKDIFPVEVKTTAKITRSLMSFINTYNIKKALVANLNSEEIKKVNDCEIFYVPFSYF